LLIITVYYQNLQTDVYESGARNDMYAKAINIASLLATTSGQPDYWDNNTVKVIGLYDAGKFNLTKFEYLINHSNDIGTNALNYQKVKIMLGTGAYNLNITLTENNTEKIVHKQSDPTYFYSFGTSPSNAEQVVIVKRLGIANLEGEPIKVTMEVILWI
jgi:hypothetical protein